MDTMFVLISYDITENKKRSRAAKYLKDFGVRVQKSVYECNITPDQYAEIRVTLRDIIDPKNDRVKLYRFCAGCGNKVEISGWGEVTQDEEFSIV